jgi:hypothetical protein
MKCASSQQGVLWFVFGDRSINELSYSMLSIKDTNPELQLCVIVVDRYTSMILQNQSLPLLWNQPRSESVLQKQNVVEQCLQQKLQFSQTSSVSTERKCWNPLMTMKVWTFMQSPFNVTLMIDTDNVANPDAKSVIGWHPLDDLVSSLGNFDIAVVHVEKSAPSLSAAVLHYIEQTKASDITGALVEVVPHVFSRERESKNH